MTQPTAEQQSARADAFAAALTAAEEDQITIDGSIYVVDVDASGNGAAVIPVGGLQHNLDRMERAAAQRTGCAATALPEFYEAMRGNRIVAIPQNRLNTAFGGSVRVQLSC